jgi:aspartyl-tRNA(Asn)/glutamyl-tRNA(Gln) amidotransferase subunit C
MVDQKIVEYVATLARIDITQEEKVYLAKQLSKIIEYIDKLKELNVEKVVPLRGLHLERNVLREDKVKPFYSKDSILNNAPSRESDYFKIPKVIE